jgi:hypothetical protein
MIILKLRLVILISFGLGLSACDRSSTPPDAGASTAQPSAQPQHVTGTTAWAPTWDTTPDKNKKAKSVLSPIVAFVDSGFRGSSTPQENGEKNREDFARAFQNDHECLGITLTLNQPENADFGVQFFNGIEGRVGQRQWVAYRMDTLGERAHGETTGGMSEVVKSVCSNVQDGVTPAGGRIEGELK